LSTASGSSAEGRTSIDELLADHVVVRQIERGPSEVRFLAEADDPTVVTRVVKTQQNPPPPGSDARTLYRLHEALESAAASAGHAPVAPRPVGWGDDPDLFAYDYAVGVPVKERMEALAPPTPDPNPESNPESSWPAEFSGIARASGALLARFHAALTPGPGHTVRAGRLHQACRRASRGSADLPSGIVRSLCDSGPHNLIVRADGDIQLIDLPTDERWTFAEFDIGVLAHRLARRAAIAFRSSATAADAHRVFTDPLCDAYVGAGGTDPDRAEVMASFASSSFVFAKRSLTIGHPHAWLGYARRDLSWGLSTLRTARRRR
jgi:hypothetical protein